MAVTADRTAPYAPASAIIDLIGRYRSRGLPSPVNADVLARAGISESLIPRTLYALQALDLVDEAGAPTPIFEGIRLAPETEYQKRLEEWLKGAYADVFSFVDPTKDDETRVRDAFRSYQPLGQQNRMVSLFQGLCVAAGLIAEKAASPSRPVVRSRSASPPPIRRALSKPSSKPHASDSSQDLPPALAGLLTSLPNPGAGWSKDAREKFMTTFGAVLDFCFPIVTNASPTDEGGGED